MDQFLCTKCSTKDNRDGLFVLHLKARPQDVPAEIKQGAYGDRYILRITQDDEPREFEAIRSTVDDDGKGFLIMKLFVLPAQAGDAVLYAPNGTSFAVEYEQQLTQSDVLPFTPEHRQATFRRLQVIIGEPAFWDYLEQFDRWGLLTESFSVIDHRQDAALEVLYRHVECHSRAEIRTNAAVCERTERLIREYRREQWNKARQAEAGRSASAPPSTAR